MYRGDEVDKSTLQQLRAVATLLRQESHARSQQQGIAMGIIKEFIEGSLSKITCSATLFQASAMKDSA